ncbi:BppU family phage baseplate upper protein [Bacillus sp. SM-B1]|uniref:BppU family phage baseplate upper protein n=1 Tax=Bacillus sp. SM-B1 TaxID=2980102 RepID=UPI002949DD6B|nr:BppU family phage baseplate upper protein [Bacillus sp. SM-B1]MDV6040469.1 BppU family phage baseplate upper protein [Bacillus sp. SM-B1]
MTYKTYEINVDLINDISTNVIRFSQNDRNSAKLLLSITNKGAELDLSQAKSIRMSFKKSDGTRVFQNDCQPINAMKGKYQILLKTQTLSSIGNVIAQIHIEEEDRILDTQKFFFVVNDSLASDEAVESTNEFTIIQKAIEAGQKLDGKDIDGIIAAGAKADAALPKAGGTMTGTVIMEAGDFGFKNPASDLLFRNNQSGIFVLYDRAQDQVIWTYDSRTKEFKVGATSNLLKNSGGNITGSINMDASTTQGYRFGTSTTLVSGLNVRPSGAEWETFLYDNKNLTSVWYYKPSTGFIVGGLTNLLKKTGDTMTGTLKWGSNAVIVQEQHKRTANAKGIFYVDEGLTTTVAGIGRYVDETGQDYIYLGHGSSPWNSTGGLKVSQTEFKYKGKDIAFKDKDGRATLTLTADAELISANGVIADRRGNTVTLRAPIRRKIGSTSALMFTLPDGMRPTMELTHNVTSISGSVGVVTISSNGNFQLGSATSSDLIPGKDFNITITYVVD